MTPSCSCSLKTEDTSHYFLHWYRFNHQRIDLVNSVKSVYHNFKSMSDNNKKDVLLYNDSCFDKNENQFILKSFINHIKISE